MSTALRIDTLHITRLPGIDAPFALTECSPGLNLVFGPNASGKSSLVRAMEAVLWPAASQWAGYTVSASCTGGTDAWRVEIDAGAVRLTRNGVASRAPALPSPELRHRYRLSLHDLLAAADDSDFASAILRASAGGLDLAAAGQALGLTDRASRSYTARAVLDQAQSALAAAQREQGTLHASSANLAQRELDAQAAERAREEAVMWRAAIAWHAASDAQRTALATRDALPSVLASLDGTEAEVATALFERWRRTSRELDEATRLAAESRAGRLAAFELAEPTRDDREQWRASLDAVQHAHAERGRTNERVRETQARGEAAQRQLGKDVHAAQLDAVTVERVEQLAEFARREAQWYAKWLQVQRDAQRLDTIVGDAARPSEPDEQRDGVRDAMRVLTRWLAANARATLHAEDADATTDRERQRRLAMLLGVTGALGWLVLAIQVRGAVVIAAVCAAVCVLLLVAAWRVTRRVPVAPDDRAALERELESLTVPAPDAWTHEAVQRRLEQCARDLAAVERLADALSQRRDLAAQSGVLNAERETLQHERAAMIASLGFAPTLDTQTLPWLVERLSRWQDAALDTAAAEAAHAAADGECISTMEALRARCAPFTNRAPQTPADAEALVAALDDRFDTHREATRAEQEAERTVARAREEALRVRSEWVALQERIGIEAPALTVAEPGAPEHMQRGLAVDHSAVQAPVQAQVHAHVRSIEALLAQRERYHRLTRTMDDAARDMANAERACPHVPSGSDASWKNLSTPELKDQLHAAEAAAARHTELIKEIATLKERMQRASRSHDVEAALAAVDEATDAVKAQFRQNVDDVIGHALLRHVQEASRDVDRPPVFHRARELFGRITHGAWQLELMESTNQDAAFHALDMRTGRTVPLNELSSGTRVQLLVAVRVAFVESEETEWKLPLFLDETLGTSDDVRAVALMDAVLSLVVEGRQVFYLTAQSDEVANWRELLARRTVPSREIDLAKVRRLSPRNGVESARTATRERDAALQARAVASPVGRATVPPLGDLTHESLGRALALPPVWPGRTPLSDTHLWYLVESVPVLHALLSLGVERWGPLSFYRTLGDPPALLDIPPDSVRDALRHADQLARALDAMHTLAEVGQGRPLDRHVLQESGVVTPRWLDEVAAAAEACHGNAQALLERLDDRAIKGFGPRAIEPLRAWLTEQGFADARTPHSAEEIRLGMIAAVETRVRAEAIDALLSRVASSTVASVGATKGDATAHQPGL